MKPVKSSNIEAIGHANGVLAVKFKNGGVYDYPGVTADEHHALMNADSVGSHFHNHIRSNYKGTKRDEK